MKNILIYINTLFRLGLWNVAYVFWYRISLKSGLRKLCFKQKKISSTGDLFQATEPRKDYPEKWKQQLVQDAERNVDGQIRYYGYHWKQVGTPPNWFLNPFSGTEYPNKQLHWTELSDFNAAVGDIKNYWEASRFEWLVTLARAYAVTGEDQYLNAINSWTNDWIENNPFNTGPNWKCGQEASIRVFNLINATLILNQWRNPATALADFVYLHLQRIIPNIRYAISQDNNHGTSEAAGLYIGGSWLAGLDNAKYPKAKRYAEKGRRWLENRVKKLISTDGGFSQHSVTYHRVMLDTLCFAEFWSLQLKGKPFSDQFYRKAQVATRWMELLTDESSGNAPNLGSNDGAMLLNTHSCNYRDFRPTLQLANGLFNKNSIAQTGSFDEVSYWFNTDTDNKANQPTKQVSTVLKSGYTVLKSIDSWALIRWPHFRFRPSHNDVMHFDLWVKGENILCDSGTYSYNAAPTDLNTDLKSVHFHNSVSFDHYEQMPKLSRFLLGNWIKAEKVGLIIENKDGKQTWTGSYRDAKGNRHERKVEAFGDNYTIYDDLSGSFEEATIGFNISQVNCFIENGSLLTSFGKICFPENTKAVLSDSIGSDYYMEKHPVKRLQLTVTKPGIYITKIICN